MPFSCGEGTSAAGRSRDYYAASDGQRLGIGNWNIDIVRLRTVAIMEIKEPKYYGGILPLPENIDIG